MDTSALSPENILATVVAGLFIAGMSIREYLKAKKQPTAQNGDRIVPSLTIADMNPVREIAAGQERMAIAQERTAAATEGMYKIMLERAQHDAIEEEVNRRIEQDRRSRTDKPPSRP